MLIYNADCTQLLFVFLSRTQLFSMLHIGRTTLNAFLNTGEVYIGHFVFTDDIIEGTDNTNALSMDEFVALFLSKYRSFKDQHGGFASNARSILITHISDPSQSFTLSSIRATARHFSVDKEIIRSHLKSGKVFRGCWVLTTNKRATDEQ